MRTCGAVPTARTGCATALLPSGLLVLHGGMLCSPSVQGLTTADIVCLDLSAPGCGAGNSGATSACITWRRVDPTMPQRVFGGAVCNSARLHHTAAVVPSAAAAVVVGGTSQWSSHATCGVAECLQLLGREHCVRQAAGTAPGKPSCAVLCGGDTEGPLPAGGAPVGMRLSHMLGAQPPAVLAVAGVASLSVQYDFRWDRAGHVER
jgi:hypothetical protein